MIELSQQIRIFLKTLHPRVYWEIAPENAVYPYLVYDFQLYPDGEGSELCTLSVDGWDKTLVGDTTVIETLIKRVNGELDENGNPTGLDKHVFSTGNFVLVVFNENKLPVKDDDKTLRRRNYNYSGQVIRK